MGERALEDCRLPTSDCRLPFENLQARCSIGNWKLAIGNEQTG
jgi:hypothetical protein